MVQITIAKILKNSALMDGLAPMLIPKTTCEYFRFILKFITKLRFADYDSFAESGREQISRCIVCQRKLNAADDNFSDYSGHSGSIGPIFRPFIN